jgi:transketolase
VLARFRAHNWHVTSCDGHDAADVSRALAEAAADPRPSLIACRTTIGYGAPTKAGTAGSHGSPLGASEIAGAREALGWTAEPFTIPEDILSDWRALGAKGAEAHAAWETRRAAHPRGAEFAARMSGDAPDTSALAPISRTCWRTPPTSPPASRAKWRSNPSPPRFPNSSAAPRT